jgi:16S rRNA G966 N2-methylase RsmD
MNKETIQFILDNEDADIHQLSLQSSRYPKVNMLFAIHQINGKQKIKSKVPLFYNTQDIIYPVQLSLEQSSSELTAIYKSTICEGNALTDLTGGLGVDCCIMSQRFKQITYVERNEELCDLAVNNFKALGKEYIKVIHSDTENYLVGAEHVDWIFIDPARRSTGGKKVVLLSDCEPNVAELSPLLLDKATHVMIKLSPMMDITAAIRELPTTSGIHIISVENECKEVLLILDQTGEEDIKVKTINFRVNKENQKFEFNIRDESKAETTFSSVPGKYLYEPNAAVMKSGAFKLIGEKFRLKKLHINTHLYTSNELSIEFPGRIFEVRKQWDNSKKELKELVARIPKANITTRNYPESVVELRKRLKVKDGGDIYLFACTLQNEKKSIIECNKIIDR